MSIKDQIKKMKSSSFFVNRALFIVIQQVYLSVRFFTDASFRSSILTRLRSGQFYHQQVTFTLSNRYPLVFQACADYLTCIKNPQVLSFGCSTGEEVFSIGSYIPGARILGVDINQWCLNQCKKKNKNLSFSFCNRISDDFEQANGFDAIFCLAVFQRTENRTNKDNFIASGFRFEQFEKEILVLDGKLKSGGLLIIDNVDFCFLDTVCAEYYAPLYTFEQNQLVRKRPLFDRNNQKIAEIQNNFRVFVKL